MQGVPDYVGQCLGFRVYNNKKTKSNICSDLEMIEFVGGTNEILLPKITTK